MVMMSVPRIVRVRFDSLAYVISYVSQLRAYVQMSCGRAEFGVGGSYVRSLVINLRKTLVSYVIM
jgi:hypothetical protein